MGEDKGRGCWKVRIRTGRAQHWEGWERLCCCISPSSLVTQVESFCNEEALLGGFVAALEGLDPDIVVSYDILREGLGFLAERSASLGLSPGLLLRVSRTPELRNPRENWGTVEDHGGKQWAAEKEGEGKEGGAGAANQPGRAPIPGFPGASDDGERMADGSMTGQGLLVVGRVTINLWEVMRSEVKLGSYTFENCCHAVLQTRVPKVR